MVEKFSYNEAEVGMIFFINGIIYILSCPLVGYIMKRKLLNNKILIFIGAALTGFSKMLLGCDESYLLIIPNNPIFVYIGMSLSGIS